MMPALQISMSSGHARSPHLRRRRRRRRRSRSSSIATGVVVPCTPAQASRGLLERAGRADARGRRAAPARAWSRSPRPELAPVTSAVLPVRSRPAVTSSAVDSCRRGRPARPAAAAPAPRCGRRTRAAGPRRRWPRPRPGIFCDRSFPHSLQPSTTRHDEPAARRHSGRAPRRPLLGPVDWRRRRRLLLRRVPDHVGRLGLLRQPASGTQREPDAVGGEQREEPSRSNHDSTRSPPNRT